MSRNSKALEIGLKKQYCLATTGPRHHANSRSTLPASPTPRRKIVLYKEMTRDLMW
jgi:hypothetical protein